MERNFYLCQIWSRVSALLSGSLFLHCMIPEQHVSFISSNCVKFKQLLVTALPFDLVITIGYVAPVTVNIAYLQYPLIVMAWNWILIYFCIPLKHLGVIPWMDWFLRHYILLDCVRKSIIFPTPSVWCFLDANRLTFSLKGGIQKTSWIIFYLNNLYDQMSFLGAPVGF